MGTIIRGEKSLKKNQRPLEVSCQVPRVSLPCAMASRRLFGAGRATWEPPPLLRAAPRGAVRVGVASSGLVVASSGLCGWGCLPRPGRRGRSLCTQRPGALFSPPRFPFAFGKKFS